MTHDHCTLCGEPPLPEDYMCAKHGTERDYLAHTMPPRLCACGLPTGSPALDQCEACEQKRDDTDYSENSGYGPDYGPPSYDEAERFTLAIHHGEGASAYNVWDTSGPEPCVVLGLSTRTDPDAYQHAREFCDYHNARTGSADLRTRRAIRDLHALATGSEGGAQ